MIEERVQLFRHWVHVLPGHILLYRDGVSETQYSMVIEDELPRIKAGCIAAGEKHGQDMWVSEITLVVVRKRHHTRFFPNSTESSETQKKDLRVGLFIDHDVIHPKQFNFYLQSHDSPEGTARTGHHVVLAKDSGYTPAQLSFKKQ